MTEPSAKQLLGEVAALGRVQQNLESMTDRQVGQKVWTDVLNELPMGVPAWSIAAEAAERLFRSKAGARSPEEVLNDLNNLPECPLCGGEMLHFVGLSEPDYKRCEGCGSKIPESTEEQR